MTSRLWNDPKRSLGAAESGGWRLPRRQAQAARPRPAPVWDTSTVLPAPESTAAVLTERERAGQAFGAALHVIRQFNPDIVIKQIDAGQLQQEADRQRGVAEQWMRVEPVLLAISAGYPSVAVRHQVAVFDATAVTLMRACSQLLVTAGEGLSREECAKHAEEATDALMSLAAEWDGLVTALHADEPDSMKPAALSRRTRGPRATAGLVRSHDRIAPRRHTAGNRSRRYVRSILRAQRGRPERRVGVARLQAPGQLSRHG